MRFQPPKIRTPSSRITTPDSAGGFGRKHYRTYDHQEWAKAVKKRDGYRCQACGARSGEFDNSGNPVWLIADHIIEIRDGGSPTDLANGRTLCAKCHSRKTAAAAADRIRKR